MRMLLLILMLASSCLCRSQDQTDIPEFGKIDKSELKTTECDFDKNAEAEVLFDVEKVKFEVYSYSAWAKISRHVRIKILNNRGLDNGNIKIDYYDFGLEAEHVDNIKAQTYNLDRSGNIEIFTLDKKSIFEKQINKKYSQKVFTLPEVKVGSVIEFSYEINGTIASGFREWDFQRSIPVKLSRYVLFSPTELEITAQEFNTSTIEEKTEKNRSGTLKTYTLNKVPALRDEPFMTCKRDYLQRMEIKPVAVTIQGRRQIIARSWGSLFNYLMSDSDFGVQLTKSIPRTSDLDDMLKSLRDPYEKMLTIYHYVQKNMEWNGFSNIWAREGVRAAWKEKKGTSGEINLILVNLLKDASLEASPILVSTRNHGRVNPVNPGPNQFDKVMAFVVIKERMYILDATDKYTSPKLIPWDVLNSDGLVLEYKTGWDNWGWQTLTDDNEIFKDIVVVNGSIDEKGELSGDATVTSYDYSRAKRLPTLKEGKEKLLDKFFNASNPSLHIDTMMIENEKADTMPLIQKINFTQNLSTSGDYKYFTTNIFTGLEKNPFTADKRYSDISFGANQQFVIAESFFIPDGYSFDEMPKNIRMMLPDTSVVFTRVIAAEQDHVSVRIDLEIRKSLFTIAEYDNFREFYKKLFDLLNEQIVIKKNKRS